ncbi:hypothetical protein Maes01_00764 [Microbulbifer aestuariivivens]|uniref:TonB C-terminal domain-containing protein n=2 Tax=Microbulbifer aestuariivivens TaxID=1908308 RepID=A0ABP9WLX6_9GAMM
MVFATAISAKAAPLMNGLALEQQFNKDRYIAAVYSDTLADRPDVLLNNNTNRQLEVRIIADSLSARRFRNQWMEGVAINNSGNTLSGQAENMVTFANVFKGRLYKGDSFTVAFDGNSGITTISLNGVNLAQVSDRNFFNILLRAWVGPVPPSTDFRDGLLASGNVDASLLGTYELLEPAPERVAKIKSSIAPQAESDVAEPAADETSVAAAPTVDGPVPAQPPLAGSIPAPTLASAGNTPSETPDTPAPTQPQAEQPAPAPAPTPKPAPVKQVAEAPMEEEEEEEDEAPLTADMILAQQIYQSMLLRHTYKFIRYPQRAQDRGQEGSVRLSVSIDKEGRILNIEPLQESRYTSLNREARQAVERASPYPAAPPQLAKESYQFTMPITFRLPN